MISRWFLFFSLVFVSCSNSSDEMLYSLWGHLTGYHNGNPNPDKLRSDLNNYLQKYPDDPYGQLMNVELLARQGLIDSSLSVLSNLSNNSEFNQAKIEAYHSNWLETAQKVGLSEINPNDLALPSPAVLNSYVKESYGALLNVAKSLKNEYKIRNEYAQLESLLSKIDHADISELKESAKRLVSLNPACSDPLAIYGLTSLISPDDEDPVEILSRFLFNQSQNKISSTFKMRDIKDLLQTLVVGTFYIGSDNLINETKPMIISFYPNGSFKTNFCRNRTVIRDVKYLDPSYYYLQAEGRYEITDAGMIQFKNPFNGFRITYSDYGPIKEKLNTILQLTDSLNQNSDLSFIERSPWVLRKRVPPNYDISNYFKWYFKVQNIHFPEFKNSFLSPDAQVDTNVSAVSNGILSNYMKNSDWRSSLQQDKAISAQARAKDICVGKRPSGCCPPCPENSCDMICAI